ncbi:MAG TPA: TlpA family protein disulfide reductase [Prolixibacteraceae bacterium]|nr:TlpA family protein disulfide reductase [Prolixibacteraceae bacterium]
MRTLILSVLILLFGSMISTLSAQSTGLEIGNKAPEIRLPTTKGDTVALSSLKGKLVLIDFWATWCSPCVEEQSQLAKLYSKYKQSVFTNGKGFEIYGVSLDAKKSNWENFIRTNKINWIQVSDLKFWRSPVAKTYNIQGLPFNVLIDDNGMILAKNLHGIDLEKQIGSFLKK